MTDYEKAWKKLKINVEDFMGECLYKHEIIFRMEDLEKEFSKNNHLNCSAYSGNIGYRGYTEEEMIKEIKYEKMWEKLKDLVKKGNRDIDCINQYFLNDMEKFLKCEDMLSEFKKLKGINLEYDKFNYESAWKRLKEYSKTCFGYISYFGNYFLEKMNEVEEEYRYKIDEIEKDGSNKI